MSISFSSMIHNLSVECDGPYDKLIDWFLHHKFQNEFLNQLIVGQNNGEDHFNESDEPDWNGPMEDYTAEEMEEIEDAIAIAIFFFSVWILMIVGFFVFAPLSICLAQTGGDLEECSFGMYD